MAFFLSKLTLLNFLRSPQIVAASLSTLQSHQETHLGINLLKMANSAKYIFQVFQEFCGDLASMKTANIL